MAFAPSKGKKHKLEKAEMPNLTTMMDMMTIILLFLLKTMSSSGQLLHAAPGIELPETLREVEPEQHLAFIVNDAGIFLDRDGKVGRQMVYREEMDDDEIQMFDNIVFYLDSAREEDKLLGRELSKIVTLQGDKQIPYKYLYKFITSCANSSFETIQFVVEKGKEG
jgi:biopolymer transport protein ExbD